MKLEPCVDSILQTNYEIAKNCYSANDCLLSKLEFQNFGGIMVAANCCWEKVASMENKLAQIFEPVSVKY